MSAWFGQDDRVEDAGEVSYGESEQEEESEDDDDSSCPMGGEHEVEEIRAATAREPLGRWCAKCKVRL